MSIYNILFNLHRNSTAFIKYSDVLSVTDMFTITAHTGALHTKANSLWSAKECIASGADIIEVDVVLRTDGTFVMLHKSQASKHEGIPFIYLLDMLKNNDVKLNVDLKSFDNLGDLQKIIMDYGMTDRAFFTGVDESRIDKVKSEAPDIPTYVNASFDLSKAGNKAYIVNFVRKIHDSGAIGLNTNYMNLNKNLVNELHTQGLLVSAWTVNNKASMIKILELGVDNITTKNPLLLRKLVGR